MNKVWVGFTHDVGDQGYTPETTSEPLIVFDNQEIANKWKKLDRNRKIKYMVVQSKTECHTCGNEL